MFLRSLNYRIILLNNLTVASKKNSNNRIIASAFLPSLQKKTTFFSSFVATSLLQQQQQQRVAAPKKLKSLIKTTILQKHGSSMAGNLDHRVIRWPKVILFGDSITQYGFSPDGCWVALLADLLQRKCDVVNRGFSGYNSRWCKKILPHIMSSEEMKDTVFVTIFLGANDCADKDINPLQHIPVDEYKCNLFDMVKEFEQLGIPAEKIILIGPPAVDEKTWAKECETKGRQLSNFNKNAILYAEACVEVAQQTGTHNVDLYTEMLKHDDWRNMLNDGLHLSKKGSHLLFSMLRPIVEKHTNPLPFKLTYWGDVDPDNLNTLID